MINIGFIGCGRHLMRSLLPNIIANVETRIVAVSDIEPQKIEEFKKRFNVECFNSGEELIKAKDKLNLHGVVISADPITHYEMTKLAIENNLHVFVEKPTGYSSEKLIELAKEADKRHLVTCVGSKWRYTNATKIVKNYLSENNLSICNMTLDVTFPPIMGTSLWGLNDKVKVAFYDMFIHAFDYLIYMMDDISILNPMLRFKNDNSISLSLLLKNNNLTAVANLISGSYAYQHNMILHLSDGSQIKVKNLNEIELTKKDTWTKTEGSFRDHASLNWSQGRMYRGYSRLGYIEEWNEFIDCIKNKKNTITNLNNASKTLKLIELCLDKLDK